MYNQLVLLVLPLISRKEEWKKDINAEQSNSAQIHSKLVDVKIAKELEKISMTIDSLKPWIEQTRSSCSFNTELYVKLCQDYDDGKI